jgi:hypothetical protein
MGHLRTIFHVVNERVYDLQKRRIFICIAEIEIKYIKSGKKGINLN